jgi:gliding motility-associated-like protein
MAIVIVTLHVSSGMSQNLIPNPGFENYHVCPNRDQDFTLEGWTLPTDGSSNNFHSCNDTDRHFSTPRNMFGYQKTRTGKGYAGIYLFSNSGFNWPAYREYLQAKLVKKLLPGKKYIFTLFTNKSNASFPVDRLEVSFSSTPVYQKITGVLPLVPHIAYTGGYIKDSVNWVEFKAEYVASGDEQYIIIGNFQTDANTNVLVNNVEGASCFYFIDDVSLYECTSLVDLGADPVICAGESLTLDAFTEGATYLWHDNSTSSEYSTTQAGLYWVEVNKDGCTTRDSVYVALKDPAFTLGNDTTLCKGQTLVIKPSNAYPPYEWSNGSVLPEITIDAPGKYFLTALADGCKRADTVNVSYEEPFQIFLGNDTTLCYGQHLRLTSSLPGTHYTWSDDTTQPFLDVYESGEYSVNVKGITCESSGSITVRFFDCPENIPNIITPNDDYKNESFVITEIRNDRWMIEIFNRWGEPVYRDANYQNNWNGNNVSAGVYYYSLSNSDSKRSYKGWIQVVK